MVMHSQKHRGARMNPSQSPDFKCGKVLATWMYTPMYLRVTLQ